MMKCWENMEVCFCFYFSGSLDHISSNKTCAKALRIHKRVLQQGEPGAPALILKIQAPALTFSTYFFLSTSTPRTSKQ